MVKIWKQALLSLLVLFMAPPLLANNKAEGEVSLSAEKNFSASAPLIDRLTAVFQTLVNRRIVEEEKLTSFVNELRSNPSPSTEAFTSSHVTAAHRPLVQVFLKLWKEFSEDQTNDRKVFIERAEKILEALDKEQSQKVKADESTAWLLLPQQMFRLEGNGEPDTHAIVQQDNGSPLLSIVGTSRITVLGFESDMKPKVESNFLTRGDLNQMTFSNSTLAFKNELWMRAVEWPSMTDVLLRKDANGKITKVYSWQKNPDSKVHRFRQFVHNGKVWLALIRTESLELYSFDETKNQMELKDTIKAVADSSFVSAAIHSNEKHLSVVISVNEKIKGSVGEYPAPQHHLLAYELDSTEKARKIEKREYAFFKPNHHPECFSNHEDCHVMWGAGVANSSRIDALATLGVTYGTSPTYPRLSYDSKDGEYTEVSNLVSWNGQTIGAMLNTTGLQILRIGNGGYSEFFSKLPTDGRTDSTSERPNLKVFRGRLFGTATVVEGEGREADRTLYIFEILPNGEFKIISRTPNTKIGYSTLFEKEDKLYAVHKAGFDALELHQIYGPPNQKYQGTYRVESLPGYVVPDPRPSTGNSCQSMLKKLSDLRRP